MEVAVHADGGLHDAVDLFFPGCEIRFKTIGTEEAATMSRLAREAGFDIFDAGL